MDRPGRHLCSDCLDRIPFIKPGEHGYEVKNTTAAVWFDDTVRKLILDYKFRGSLEYIEDFVDFLEAGVRGNFRLNSINAVTELPSNPLHRFLRGYNQTEYLAERLAKRLELPYERGVLKRIGYPKRQSGLSEEERRENVKGTFTVRRSSSVENKTFLVVDDIMTTGSTLAEAMKTIEKAGSKGAFGIAIAKTQNF